MSKHGSTLEVSAINQTRPSCFGRTGPNVRFHQGSLSSFASVQSTFPTFTSPAKPRMGDSWKAISMFVEHRFYIYVELKRQYVATIFKKKISDKNDFIYIHYVHVCAITIINQSTPQCMLTHSQRRNVVSSHRHRTGPCNFSANSSQVGAKTFQRKAHCSDSGRLPFGTRTFHHAYYMETSKETEQNTSFYCCIYVMIKE